MHVGNLEVGGFTSRGCAELPDNIVNPGNPGMETVTWASWVNEPGHWPHSD
jgi:hypothetical protein